MSNKMKYGERMAELRRSKHMTQEALADLLDVSPKHISHVERNCASLSLNNLVAVCRIFNCSLDYLILGEYHDVILEKIPRPITQILSSDDEKEISRLLKYLEIYSELYMEKNSNKSGK